MQMLLVALADLIECNINFGDEIDYSEKEVKVWLRFYSSICLIKVRFAAEIITEAKFHSRSCLLISSLGLRGFGN